MRWRYIGDQTLHTWLNGAACALAALISAGWIARFELSVDWVLTVGYT